MEECKEFTLPKKWWVRVTDENRDALNKWREKQPGAKMDYPLKEKLVSDSWTDKSYCAYIDDDNLIGYTEISFEEFKEHVLKEKEMKEKEIIGYKLVKPEYEKAAEKIMMVNFSPRLWVTVDSCINDLKKAGVLGLWFEPVYETKYNVGDWIVCRDYKKLNLGAEQIVGIEDDNYCINGRIKVYSPDYILREATPEEIREASFKVGDWVVVEKPCLTSSNEEGKIGQISKIVQDRFLKGFGACTVYKIKGGSWEHISGLRKASKDEIENVTNPPRIIGYDVIISPNKKSVKVGCKVFSKDVVESLVIAINAGLDVEKNQSETILKIWERLNN